MMPLPGDTVKTIHQNKEFALHLAELGAVIQISATVAFPGTALYNQPDKFGVNIHDHRWKEFAFNKPHLTVEGIPFAAMRKLFFSIAKDFTDARQKSTQKNIRTG